MKVRTLLAVIIATFTILSCEKSDCNDGLKSGDELGTDCGGDCPKCFSEEDCATLTYRVTLENPSPADSIIRISIADESYFSYETYYMNSGDSIWSYTRQFDHSISDQRGYKITIIKLQGESTEMPGGYYTHEHGLYRTNFTLEILKGGQVLNCTQVSQDEWSTSTHNGEILYYSNPQPESQLEYQCQFY